MNRLTNLIKTDVGPALVQAGLPPASIEPFVLAAETGSVAALQKVPGVTPTIIQVGISTLTSAYAGAFRITWLATIAFGGLAVIAAIASRDIDDKLSHDVIRRLGPAGWLGKQDQSGAMSSTARAKEEEPVEHKETI